jgi:hypothetical protein
MSYNNLTNDEIAFLYQITNVMKEQYESVIEKEYLEQVILNGTETSFKVQTELPAEFLEQIKEGCHYKYLKSISSKLKSIYELIAESEPEIVEEIEKNFTTKKE